MELAHEPFILFERGVSLTAIIDAAGRRPRITLVEAAVRGHADFIIEWVSAGLGVAHLPRLVVSARRPLSIETVWVDGPDLRWQPV